MSFIRRGYVGALKSPIGAHGETGCAQNVTGKYNQRIFGDHMQEFHGTHKHTINGFRDQKMLAGFTQEISGRAYEQSARAGMIQTVEGGDLIQNISQDHQQHVDGSLFQTVGGEKHVTITGNLEQEVHGTTDWIRWDTENSKFIGEKIELKMGTLTDITIGNCNEVKVAAQIEVNLGPKVDTKEELVEKLNNKISQTLNTIMKHSIFVVKSDQTIVT